MPSPEIVKPLVRERDGAACAECGMTREEHIQKFGRDLDVHRINPGSTYSADGCITLCRPCHYKKPKREPWLRMELEKKIEVRAEPEWLERVAEAAKFLGLPISGYIRMVVTQRMNLDGVPAVVARRPKKKPD